MTEQLNMFGEAEVQAKPSADYDPMTDMAFQPPNCQDCGAPYRRDAAYLFCTANREHWRMMECPGDPYHKDYEAFCRYRRQIGHPIDE